MQDREIDTLLVPQGILKVPAELKLNAVQRARIMEARRERVAYFMMLGYTENRMAEELGVSPSLIHYDIQEIRDLWQARTLDNVAQAAMTDLARLDFMIAGLLPRSLDDPRSAEAVLRCISQRATILGYAQGVTFDIEAYVRNIAESNGYDPDAAIEIAAKISVTLR